MAEPQQPVDQQVADTQQVTAKTPATKQKNPKRVAAGKAIAERTRIAREAQKKRLLSRHKASLRRQNMLIHQPKLPILQPRHLLPNLHRRPKTFLQQHNGWALSASSFHRWGSTKNAKRSKKFSLKKPRRRLLFCHARLHLLMLHLKQPSVKWIRLSSVLI